MPFFGGSDQYKIVGTNIKGGKDALNVNIGVNNMALGNGSLTQNTVGNQNIAIGNSALFSNIDGDNNVVIGHLSVDEANADLSNATVIGNSVLTNPVSIADGSTVINTLRDNVTFGNLIDFNGIAIGYDNGIMGNGTTGNVLSGILIGDDIASRSGGRVFNSIILGKGIAQSGQVSNSIVMAYEGLSNTNFNNVTSNKNIMMLTEQSQNNNIALIQENVFIGSIPNSLDTSFALSAENNVMIGQNIDTLITLNGVFENNVLIGDGILNASAVALKDSIVIGANINLTGSDDTFIQIGNPAISYDRIYIGDINLNALGSPVESVTAGNNISVDNTDPQNPVISSNAVVGSLVAGTGINIDDTDPVNPIISTVSGGGVVVSIVAGANITVDDTDPANPVISASGGGGGGFSNNATQSAINAKVSINSESVGAGMYPPIVGYDSEADASVFPPKAFKNVYFRSDDGTRVTRVEMEAREELPEFELFYHDGGDESYFNISNETNKDSGTVQITKLKMDNNGFDKRLEFDGLPIQAAANSCTLGSFAPVSGLQARQWLKVRITSLGIDGYIPIFTT